MNVVARVQQFSCPCCGSFIGEASTIEQVRESLTAPAQRLIFDALARSVGKPVHRETLFDRIYGNRADGGPERGEQVLTVHVSQLRRKIEPFGWTITASRGGSGNLAQWRLIPTEVSA